MIRLGWPPTSFQSTTLLSGMLHNRSFPSRAPEMKYLSSYQYPDKMLMKGKYHQTNIIHLYSQINYLCFEIMALLKYMNRPHSLYNLYASSSCNYHMNNYKFSSLSYLRMEGNGSNKVHVLKNAQTLLPANVPKSHCLVHR